MKPNPTEAGQPGDVREAGEMDELIVLLTAAACEAYSSNVDGLGSDGCEGQCPCWPIFEAIARSQLALFKERGETVGVASPVHLLSQGHW